MLASRTVIRGHRKTCSRLEPWRAIYATVSARRRWLPGPSERPWRSPRAYCREIRPCRRSCNDRYHPRPSWRISGYRRPGRRPMPATTRRFYTVLADDAVAQLDELVATTQTLPDGTSLTHYGIVVEGTSVIEGAELPSDTARISRDHTMPGITTRRVEVATLRTVPELWLAPAPGAPVVKATGADREACSLPGPDGPALGRRA